MRALETTFPVDTSHARVVLSLEPDTRMFEQSDNERDEREKGRQIRHGDRNRKEKHITHTLHL